MSVPSPRRDDRTLAGPVEAGGGSVERADAVGRPGQDSRAPQGDPAQAAPSGSGGREGSVELANPRGQRRVAWRRVLASLVAVALCGLALLGCTPSRFLECGDTLVVTFPALDLNAIPSASVWVDGFRYCKEAVPLDYTEYQRAPRGAPCGVSRSAELRIPVHSEAPVTVRLNYGQNPGPTRTFEIDFDDREPDAFGCREQNVTF